KPIENAFIESFNGRFRDECLNVHQFASIADAQTKIEAWRLDYNRRRPHGSLGPQVGASSMPRSPRQSPVAQEPGPRRLTKSTPSSNPIHDERGRFAKGNRVGGRTVGAKDKFFSRRGVGSLRRAYQEFIEQRDGHRKMVDALEAGIKNPKTALGFMELGAKVLDKTEEIAGRVVHFHIHTNVDPFKLRAAGAPHGLVGRP